MSDAEDPTFLSVLERRPGGLCGAASRASRADADSARILRSVLMKPEHELVVERLHERVQALAQVLLSALSQTRLRPVPR